MKREQSKRDPYEAEVAVWQTYIENKHAVSLRRVAVELELDQLICTQSEIELIKYELVRHEKFRTEDPIAVYRGRISKAFIIDGHTRARAALDAGEKTIATVLLTCKDVAVDLEVNETALHVGDGKEMSIRDIPIRDRLGRNSPAWKRRRRELMRKIS